MSTDAAQVAVTPAARAVPRPVIDGVARRVRRLCRKHAAKLPFHGWHHVGFVRDKAAYFAGRNGADPSVAETAALVHDLNYIVRRNSSAAAGRELRMPLLAKAGVEALAAEWIDDVVVEAEMCTRTRDISLEAQALSDADTLFKALPTTPVVLAHRYLEENGIGLAELAAKIVGEQGTPHDDGFYFYDEEAARRYGRWATANLELWRCIQESLDDQDVDNLLGAIPRS
ncbi:uncharacterized protein EV193_11826 [Herbihabitans rhizosphaerae]|uniref:HD family phosphohydrolase n=1 Tax=Herbihabitans rhizosphaerae TaxID=1872711 RepID=A0A4Q7KBY9_9PSEU|nr:HD family phosphohydrolase [Herbihabitans rhizosphaerae]RZS29772.1 uncharacterized protein EV193_11826 [Herbihabitans rhizosphaerae]